MEGKIWVRPTPRDSTQDGRIRVTESRDGVPHPSESQALGNPRPVNKYWKWLYLSLPIDRTRSTMDLTAVSGMDQFMPEGVV